MASEDGEEQDPNWTGQPVTPPPSAAQDPGPIQVDSASEDSPLSSHDVGHYFILRSCLQKF